MLETLYYFCYYAYLQGDLKRTSMYYDLLKEEFKEHGRPEALKRNQYEELKKIREAIRTGNISRNKWLTRPAQEISSTQPATSLKQKDLIKQIDRNSNQLKNFLQDNISLYNIEHPCGPYGQVDMVYKGRNTIYPIEVKKDQGQHDLIGQILKYDLYHRLNLHYKHYDYVQSITICNSYNPFTLKELKQAGIKTFAYSVNNTELILTPL